jgi:hypothetical protein
VFTEGGVWWLQRFLQVMPDTYTGRSCSLFRSGFIFWLIDDFLGNQAECDA